MHALCVLKGEDSCRGVGNVRHQGWFSREAQVWYKTRIEAKWRKEERSEEWMDA